MTHIINNRIQKKGSKYRCPDIIPIDDGTISGDDRYCALSLKCKQIGYRSVGARIGNKNGIDEYDFLCTGWKMEEGEFTVEVI